MAVRTGTAAGFIIFIANFTDSHPDSHRCVWTVIKTTHIKESTHCLIVPKSRLINSLINSRQSVLTHGPGATVDH